MYICYTDANTLGENLGCFITSAVIVKKIGEVEHPIISKWRVKRFESINKAENDAFLLGSKLVKNIGIKKCKYRSDNTSIVSKYSGKYSIEHIARKFNLADKIVRNAECAEKIKNLLELEYKLKLLCENLNNNLVEKREKLRGIIKANKIAGVTLNMNDTLNFYNKKIEENKKLLHEVVDCAINGVSDMNNLDIIDSKYLPCNLEDAKMINKIEKIGRDRIDIVFDAVIKMKI